MARNRKPEYLKKLLQIKTANGYKVDISNYLYNPAIDNDYPALRKVVEETPEKITFSQVYFMKYWDGRADYRVKTYTAPNNSDTWHIVDVVEEKTLKEAKRFSLTELVKIAEAI